MTKLEILNSIKEKRLKIAEILDAVGAEKRELTNVEKITMEAFNEEIKELEQRAKTVNEKPEKAIVIGGTIGEDKFSLTRYLRNIAENNLNDYERELNKRSKVGNNLLKGYALPFVFEQRTLTAGTAGTGAEIVAEDKFDLLMPLRAKSVLAKAGATILTNLTANFSIPKMTGSTAAWKGETTAAADGGNGLEEVEFAPKKLTVYLPVSRQLLYQSSIDIEAKIKQDLVNSINGKLEETLLGASAGSSTQPAGLFYGASYVSTGTTDWSKVVALETTVNSNNADVDSMFYLIHPNTLGKFKTTAKASNTAAFIADGGTINGYKYLVTTHMPTISTGKGIAFGNFADMYVNMWNTMDVIVDPYTNAKEGIINYIVTLYVDGGNVRDESITKGWLS